MKIFAKLGSKRTRTYDSRIGGQRQYPKTMKLLHFNDNVVMQNKISILGRAFQFSFEDNFLTKLENCQFLFILSLNLTF